ncbi:MAG: dihydroneopterin triphosphate diphosphatase [Gammaproteobacteria bacterium]|jgi:dATP pyrophosphohydrolase
MPDPAWKRPESVLVVVHTADRVLLLQRVRPAGFWQSVTGSLEGGETPTQAAVRELGEETGLDGGAIRNLGLVQTFPIAPAWRERYAPDVVENREHAFALCLESAAEPRINPAEHRTFRWLGVDQALETASSWTDAAAIRQIFRARGR